MTRLQRVDDHGFARTRLDCGAVHALEKVEVGARPVDAEVRDGDAVPGCERHGLADPLQHRVAVDAVRLQLEIGDGRLDHRVTEAELDERLDVCLDCAREAPDLGAQAGVRDHRDRACIVLRNAREAGFDPFDPQPVEQVRDLELLLWIERDADGLLAVAQRRVVEADRPAPLRLERAAVEIAEIEVVARNRHARTIPSGKEHSFSGSPSVTSQLSFDAQAAAALPVDPRLDREHHSLADRARAGLVRVGRLVRAGADAVRDGMRRLTGVAGLGDAGANEPVELGQVGPVAAVSHRAVVHAEQLLLELDVARVELARAQVLRVVAPVAVGADPDLEQGRLVLLRPGGCLVAVKVLIPGPDQTSA